MTRRRKARLIACFLHGTALFVLIFVGRHFFESGKFWWALGFGALAGFTASQLHVAIEVFNTTKETP